MPARYACSARISELDSDFLFPLYREFFSLSRSPTLETNLEKKIQIQLSIFPRKPKLLNSVEANTEAFVEGNGQ